MYVLISALMAVIPGIALVIYYYRQDSLKAEPKGLILKVFALGVVSVAPVIVVELVLSAFGDVFGGNQLLFFAFRAFVVAAVCEEGFKLLIVKQAVYRKGAFDEVMDGVVYTVVASMGFATFENIMYVMQNGIEVAVLRALTAVPMHAFASGIMGYYIGKARFAPDPVREDSFIMKGLLIAIGIHGTYNFLIFIMPLTGSFSAILLLPLVIGSFFALKGLIRKAKNEDTEMKRDVEIPINK